MHKARVLLLNPPGKELYLRDYYCSKVSQADYIYAPIDLLYLSGILNEKAEVSLIDAIADRLGRAETLRRIDHLDPRLIVGLMGSASLAEDEEFYARLGERTNAQILLSGDLFLEAPADWLRRIPAAAGLIQDFTTTAVLRFLQGERRDLSIHGLMLADPPDWSTSPPPKSTNGTYRIPVPRHDLFLRLPYRHPFVRRRRFATVMTDFGCPYRCTFCVMPGLGWKRRPVDNVFAELRELNRLQVREILFLDQTFGLHRDRTMELLQAMSLAGDGFGWVCFTRPDCIDDRLASAMKSAGCHSVILGLESGSPEVLEAAQKDYRRDQIREGFEVCRRQGIRTVATLILGLPEESLDTFRQTLEFLGQVDPDFASFNVAVPRMGTPLRERSLHLGLASSELVSMDQSGSSVAMPTLHLSRQDISRLRREAVRSFYFNSRYLVRRLRALAAAGSGYELSSHLKQATSLARRLMTQAAGLRP